MAQPHHITARERAMRVVVAVTLLALAWGILQYRRQFIRKITQHIDAATFATRETVARAPALPPGESTVAPTTSRLRVVLVDGLSRSTAERLHTLGQVCARGLDLVVDVGFPTVSLPVQSVLWTGLTQQQSGIEFVGKQLRPSLTSIASEAGDSVAVAEYHPFIVHSLGFRRTQPAAVTLDKDAKKIWVDTGFAVAAREAVTSDSRLAFVHVLRVDSAGHAHGRDSDAYREAAQSADDLLGELIEADAHKPDTVWIVLSDHGHRAQGGHGGAEPEIRLVRACIAGMESVQVKPGQRIHLVDLSRTIADLLSVPPNPASAGRPLASAVQSPALGATLPTPGARRWMLASATWILALVLGIYAGRGLRHGVPWWFAIAYASVALIEAVPTLSNPMVYTPEGRTMYTAALPGLAVLAISTALALRRDSAVRIATAKLAFPLASVIAALILCWGNPPLMPRWSAHASLFLTLAVTGLVVVSLAHLAVSVPFGSGRGSRAETADRPV